MCTLLVAFRTVPGVPLVVAANRDERLDRPSAPPSLWPAPSVAAPHILAPRDLQAGGTWLGLNDRGLFVGVTNRFGVPKDDARRSRGELVALALEATSARQLGERLASLSPSRYNAFHLFYADATEAFVTWSDGARVTHETLSPGVHVVTERSLGASDEGRTERVLRAWQALPSPPTEEALEAVMRIHGESSPIEGTCVHVPALGYGTKSSMVLFVPDTPRRPRMRWAEGSPCVTAYEDVPLSVLGF